MTEADDVHTSPEPDEYARFDALARLVVAAPKTAAGEPADGDAEREET